MRASETYTKILGALAKARPEIPAIKKDSDNPYFHSRYASLGAIMDAVMPVLRRHGVEVVQTAYGDSATAAISTALVHVESGEFVEGTVVVPIPADKATAQAVGSGLSYARRYGLATMVGVVADDDDDGNAASGATKPAETGKAPAAPRPLQPQADPRLEEIRVRCSRMGKTDDDKKKLWSEQKGDLDAIIKVLKEEENKGAIF